MEEDRRSGLGNLLSAQGYAERTRMIESHTPPVRQIESKESQAPESVVRAAPEHINKLLEELYQSMGTGRRA